MKLGNWSLHFFSPFKKMFDNERFIGLKLYKDWHHDYEYDVRFSLLKYPHLTIVACYTTGKKYVERFIKFRSKSYCNKYGDLTFYENRKYVQGIDEGRSSCG